MKNFILFLVLLFCFGSNATEAQKIELTDYEVSINTKDNPKLISHKGVLNSLENNSVSFTLDLINGKKQTAIPFDDIYLLKVKKKGSAGKGIIIEFMSGLLTGAIANGYGKKDSCARSSTNYCIDVVPKWTGAIMLGVVGGAFGGIITSVPISVKLGPGKNNPKRVKEKILEVL